jgi:hypothetical protein
MSHVIRLFAIAAVALAAVGSFAGPAAANTQEKSVIHVDETYIDSSVCAFDLTVHLDGSFKNVDHYDNSGFLYKTIDTVGGGGPFTVTYTAHGTTLTMQNEAFSVVLTYNRDGSVRTYTQRGLFDKFTTPGRGIVLLDTGIASFQEPSEEILFIAGPHQAVNGDFDAFCAAFG